VISLFETFGIEFTELVVDGADYRTVTGLMDMCNRNRTVSCYGSQDISRFRHIMVEQSDAHCKNPSS
jgi:hypothetical protein